MVSSRQNFHENLVSLQRDILRMGSLVEQMIEKAVDSLARQDLSLADEVFQMELQIDDLELVIEDKCLKLIATQQPMAKDLRRITAGFKIITDLERMADYSVDIAKVTKRLSGEELIKPLIDIPRMANITKKMVNDALDSYVREDVELATQMCKDDDMVDHIYSQIFRELLTYMLENQKTITQATYLLFVGRYIERIADHATNIGERVIYLVTGERKELND